MTIKEGKTVNKKVLMHYQTKKFFFFFLYLSKNKEMLQRKERENYQNLPEEEKNRKHQYACEQYRKLFIEN